MGNGTARPARPRSIRASGYFVLVCAVLLSFLSCAAPRVSQRGPAASAGALRGWEPGARRSRGVRPQRVVQENEAGEGTQTNTSTVLEMGMQLAGEAATGQHWLAKLARRLFAVAQRQSQRPHAEPTSRTRRVSAGLTASGAGMDRRICGGNETKCHLLWRGFTTLRNSSRNTRCARLDSLTEAAAVEAASLYLKDRKMQSCSLFEKLSRRVLAVLETELSALPGTDFAGDMQEAESHGEARGVGTKWGEDPSNVSITKQTLVCAPETRYKGQKAHWSRKEVRRNALIQGEDVGEAIKRLRAMYFQKYGEHPGENDIRVWEMSLRAMRVDCTEAKMLGGGGLGGRGFHQVVQLSGILLTRNRTDARSCETPECGQRAWYGSKSARLPVRCAAHRLKSDLRLLRSRRMCNATDMLGGMCPRRAVFGRRGLGPRHCRWHREAGEEDLEHARCKYSQQAGGCASMFTGLFGLASSLAGDQAAACDKQALYGDPVRRRATFCAKHKPEGYIEVKALRSKVRRPLDATQRKRSLGAADSKLQQRQRNTSMAIRESVCSGQAVTVHLSKNSSVKQKRAAPRGIAHEDSAVGQKRSDVLQVLGAARPTVLDKARLAIEIYECRPRAGKTKYARALCRMSELSARFGVSPKTIRDIWHRKSWAGATRPFWSPGESEWPCAGTPQKWPRAECIAHKPQAGMRAKGRSLKHEGTLGERKVRALRLKRPLLTPHVHKMRRGVRSTSADGNALSTNTKVLRQAGVCSGRTGDFIPFGAMEEAVKPRPRRGRPKGSMDQKKRIRRFKSASRGVGWTDQVTPHGQSVEMRARRDDGSGHVAAGLSALLNELEWTAPEGLSSPTPPLSLVQSPILSAEPEWGLPSDGVRFMTYDTGHEVGNEPRLEHTHDPALLI